MVTCYLDESGTDDLSPTAVVGGLILNHYSFFWFDVEWSDMLKRHKVEPPLHMKKLPRTIDRKALFADAVTLINTYKGASLAATLSTETFDKHFGTLFKGRTVIGVYGMCFMLAVVLNNKFAEEAKYKGNIPFVMDTGNVYKRHVVDVHRFTVSSDERYNFRSPDIPPARIVRFDHLG